MTMNKHVHGLLIATQLLASWIAVAQTNAPPVTNGGPAVVYATNQQTRQAIAAFPSLLDFGTVALGSTNQLSFTLQNAGGRPVAGMAAVAAPFSIVAGHSYLLNASQDQEITIQYAPKSLGIHMAVVRLTGGGGATVTVMGSAVRAVPARRSRPAEPLSPQNLRFIARQ